MTTLLVNPTPPTAHDELAYELQEIGSKGPRFTLDGSEQLEAHLTRTCDFVLAGIRAIVPEDKLEAVLLGGSYGRGEGGVLKTDSGDEPFNDLEFYVCLQGNDWLNRRRYNQAFSQLGAQLSSAAGVEVEFKIISLAKLARAPASMFYFDLVMGHRWVLGDEHLLDGCEHHCCASRIPLSEATRLLMNRCSGLLFAEERMRRRPFTRADAEFVGRNLAKAQLALGDTVLTAYGQYRQSCRDRHNRFMEMPYEEDTPWLPEVCELHRRGVQFKLHPKRVIGNLGDLQRMHSRLVSFSLLVWLWLESYRLNRPFGSVRDYVFDEVDKCPETDALRNRLICIAAFGPAQLFKLSASHHPRQRLLHAMALLLWEPAAIEDPVLISRLQRELGTRASNFEDLLAAYKSLWSRFS